MFDDIPSSAGAGGHPPSNLPVTDVEDIFGVTEKEDASAPGSAAPIVPRIAMVSSAAVPTALDAGILQPTKEVSQAVRESTDEFPPLAPRPQERRDAKSGMFSGQTSDGLRDELGQENQIPEFAELSSPKSSRKKVLVIVLLIAVAGGLVFGGILLYRSWSGFPTPSSLAPADLFVPSTTDGSADDLNDGVLPSTSEDNQAGSNADLFDVTTDDLADEQILFGEPVDVDADGLDDDREKGLGTDPKHWDSDADQLSDGDEVVIWKTDPLNPDTDGDTYQDGAEVTNGYNPAGPGKIFEPPVAGASGQGTLESETL